MRFPAIQTWRATAGALAALALLAAPVIAEPAPLAAQAMAPDTDTPAAPEAPTGETPPTGETTPPPDEQAEEPKAIPDRPIKFGERRRVDPFEANEDDPETPPGAQPAAHSDDGVITCVAGCGRTGSTTSYRQRKEAARQ